MGNPWVPVFFWWPNFKATSKICNWMSALLVREGRTKLFKNRICRCSNQDIWIPLWKDMFCPKDEQHKSFRVGHFLWEFHYYNEFCENSWITYEPISIIRWQLGSWFCSFVFLFDQLPGPFSYIKIWHLPSIRKSNEGTRILAFLGGSGCKRSLSTRTLGCETRIATEITKNMLLAILWCGAYDWLSLAWLDSFSFSSDTNHPKTFMHSSMFVASKDLRWLDVVTSTSAGEKARWDSQRWWCLKSSSHRWKILRGSKSQVNLV